MADEVRATFGLPPTETVEFFRAKGTFPQSARWDDVWQEEHARAFTVAKIMDRQLLERVRASLDDVIANGGTFAEWKKVIIPQLQEAGWWGRVDREELTGVDYPIFVGKRRLRTIFDTNLRMARAAGQWKRIQALKDVAPYLMYVAVKDNRTRPAHALWGGNETGRPIILPVDHPAWRIYFPPNGWLCRCNVIQLSDDDLQANGWRVTTDAELVRMGWMTAGGEIGGNPRAFRRSNGSVERVPGSIDPGFAYNVGERHLSGLAPPPATGPISEPHINVADLPPLPPARKRPASALIDRDTPPDEAISRFLDMFEGPTDGITKLARDVTGEPLVLSESFFFRGGVRAEEDSFKLVDKDRVAAIQLLADALKDPDEIWWMWEQVKGPRGTMRWRLTRRYIAQFSIDGKAQPFVVVMDTDADGWKGVTALKAARPSYLNKPQVRGGVLAYRRK